MANGVLSTSRDDRHGEYATPTDAASLSGASLTFRDAPPVAAGDRIVIEMPGIGLLSASVKRATANRLGVAFEDLGDETTDNLIRLLYSQPRDVSMDEPAVLWTMLKRWYSRELA